MQDLDILTDGIPEDVCLLIKYSPHPHKPSCCFRIDWAQGPKLKPYLASVKKHFPKTIFYTPDAEEDRTHLWFGSPDKEDNDTIADWFDVNGYPNHRVDDYSPHVTSPEAQGPRIHFDYPWHIMKEVGHHFIVEGEKSSHVAVAAHRRSQQVGHKFITKALDHNRTLVLMIDRPGYNHRDVVRIMKEG